MSVVKINVGRIREYLKRHPKSTALEVLMGLDILFSEWTDAKAKLRNEIKVDRDGLTYRFSLKEVKDEKMVSELEND